MADSIEKASPLSDPLAMERRGDVPITEEEKEKFFKCFLADETYATVIPMFKGKWKVGIRALTVEENDDVLRQIALDQKLNVATSNDSYLILILEYRLSLAIQTLNGVPFQPELTKAKMPFDEEKGTSYIKERIKVFQAWPMYKLSAVTEVFRTFEQKIQKLSSEVVNENFWKAVV